MYYILHHGCSVQHMYLYLVIKCNFQLRNCITNKGDIVPVMVILLLLLLLYLQFKIYSLGIWGVIISCVFELALAQRLETRILWVSS